MSALYRLEGAALRYGATPGPAALEVPSLRIGEGERILCVGPNGSGKSTFLKALNGLMIPSAGTIDFMGCAAHLSPEIRARTVYLHQHPYIMSGSVAYNVGFGCRARGMGHGETARRVESSLVLLGLEGFASRRHRALSGGEAQRVAIARALATGAEVLLLDEPTAGVDAASESLVRAALRAAAEAGATLVFSTHDESLMEGFATRRLVFSQGAIVADKTIPEGIA